AFALVEPPAFTDAFAGRPSIVVEKLAWAFARSNARSRPKSRSVVFRPFVLSGPWPLTWLPDTPPKFPWAATFPPGPPRARLGVAQRPSASAATAATPRRHEFLFIMRLLANALRVRKRPA